MQTATQDRIQNSPATDPRERLLAALPVTERRLTLNGVSTAVLEGGQGKPVVLLHGPATYGAIWMDVITALAKTHQVIAPDLPGHGASAFFDSAPAPQRVIGWLDDLVECCCAQPPVLVGEALGGAIAARFAAEGGRPLAALVLVDAWGLADFTPTQALGAALQSFLQAPTGTTFEGLWSACIFDLEGVRQRLGERWQWIEAYCVAGMQLGGSGPLLAWLEHFGMHAMPDTLLARIRTPTRLIWGRHDPVTSVAVAETASGRFGWPLEVIEDAGDAPIIERPGIFVDALHRALGAA
ncbi:MAG TPA: alpha/beta hydrolase [Steroidobacteraceae bacterium]|nr:alpha/beta hydrolase [Steroidobacteraceae bacterium]